MLSVNEIALEIVETMLDYEEELRIQSKKLENDATIVDCGVNVPGSYEAGILYTQICMGGLADVNIVVDTIRDVPFAFITEYTDHPAIACLGSQKAGWAIKVEKYFAMGSGPARALALKPKKTYEKIGYEDDADVA
ncbi:MAG: methenyltetrahydromethanopterin cyclohydrolase, partial [Archaeoglobaceae archaeon]